MECQLQHGWANRRKKARASDNLVAAGDGEDVSRIQVVVLIPLVTICDGDIPFEPPAEYLSAQPVHLFEKSLMLDISVGRDGENLHPYLRVNFVSVMKIISIPGWPSADLQAVMLVSRGNRVMNQANAGACEMGWISADLQFPPTIRHQWNLTN
ncbi:hypothetical protein L907_21970 [Agrobacterium sp. C13]|nr:hypothetical protein L906_22010 [Agrobacterium sp. TS45]KVK66296.1 hypothetical protein L907_21970 [Agrobacterium sp. C13]